MFSKNRIYNMVIAAMLCAIGIIIPIIFRPISIQIPPASYTPASHVAIFIAMIISPYTALFVGAGTTIGFFFSGVEMVIVARAASHLVFLLVGSLILRKKPDILKSPLKTVVFALLISILHAACEVAVVAPFYMNGSIKSPAVYEKGFFLYGFWMIGVLGCVHSMIDFYIALYIWKPLQKIRRKTPAAQIK